MTDRNPKDIAGSEKTPLRYVPPSLAEAVARPMEHGAKKYGFMNWRRQPISLTKHLEAVERHIAEVKDGNDIDDDSGDFHLNHAAAALAVIIDAKKHGTLIDDRDPEILGEGEFEVENPIPDTVKVALHTHTAGPPPPEVKLPLYGPGAKVDMEWP